MTKNDYINNIEILQNDLIKLKETSLESYIKTNIYNYINKEENPFLATEYIEYMKLINKNILSIEEQKKLNKILNKYMKIFIDSQNNLETQIIEKKNNLSYFSDKNNLNIRDWFEEYYYPVLKKDQIEKEIIEIKTLGSKYYNHELKDKEIAEFKNLFLSNKFVQMHIICLYKDYNKYLKEQVTKNTEYIDLKKVCFLYNSNNEIIGEYNIMNYLKYFY